MSEVNYPEKAEFSHLVMILASTASVGLGDVPEPMSGERKLNLSQARFHIDLLSVLEEKSRGNLGEEEAKGLKELLAALRMRWIEVQGSTEKK